MDDQRYPHLTRDLRLENPFLIIEFFNRIGQKQPLEDQALICYRSRTPSDLLLSLRMKGDLINSLIKNVLPTTSLAMEIM